jgi:ATP-dependent protease ClpP protease subunit
MSRYIGYILAAILIVAGLLAFTTGASAQAVLSINQNRVAKIHGTMGNGLFTVSSDILKMAERSKAPIYLDIDSGGGSIVHTILLMTSMEQVQSKGIRIYCVVRGMAASAAFSVLNECDARFTYRTSLLMFHPARLMRGPGGITREEMERDYTSLTSLEVYLIERLKLKLRLTDAEFQKHYDAETFHVAEAFSRLSPSYLTLIRGVRYVDGPK